MHPTPSPFDVPAMLDMARAATGLDDFGDPTFRTGLDALADALPAARLSDIGTAALQGQLTGYLCERLRIEDWHVRHPEIGAQSIAAPVVVTGLPRTGTTALSNLLAADPAARSLRFWESQRPTPPPETATYWTDPRIADADAMLAGMKQAAPDLARMHDDTGASPTEHQDLLGQHFATPHFEGMADVPAYIRWWLGCDMVPAYRHHRRVLQLLQWRCPPLRWNLKNPPDVCALEAFVTVYPDARFVWTHRDPAKVLPSVCKLIQTIQRLFSNAVDPHALGRQQLAFLAEGMRRGLAFRRRAGDARFADVFMHDLVARPIDSVAAVYARFDLRFDAATEAAMRTWAADNPQHKHGTVATSLDEFGLTLDAVRDAFRDYTRHFDVRLET